MGRGSGSSGEAARRALRAAWALGVVGSGCGPAGADACRAMAAGPARDECWGQHAPELFRADPQAAAALVESEVADPQIRDFIYLTVTRDVDPSSYTWCDRIQEPALKARCRVLVSRPHLHRELIGGGAGDGPAGAGGGPPPGSGAGPGGLPPGGGPPPPGGGPPPPGERP